MGPNIISHFSRVLFVTGLTIFSIGCQKAETTRTAGAGAGGLVFLNGDTEVSSITFDGTTLGGKSSFTVTLSNSGATEQSGISGTFSDTQFSYAGGTFPGTSGTCSTTIPGGEKCNVVLTFNPSSTGLKKSTWVLTSQNIKSQETKILNLEGTGEAEKSISISGSDPIDFGTVTVGNTSDSTITISNSGSKGITGLAGDSLTGVYTYKGGSFPGTGGTCSTTLSASTTCTVVITFTPTTSSTLSSTFTLRYDSGTTTRSASRALTGVGSSTASLSISDGTTYDYGSTAVNSNTDKTFTITNSGAVTATAMSFSLATGTQFTDVGGTCSTTLSASGTCTKIIRFSATASGAKTDTLTLSYTNGITSTSTTRALQGTGYDAAVLKYRSTAAGAYITSYSYSDTYIGATTDVDLYIVNAGNSSATSVTSSLSGVFTFPTGTFPGAASGATDADCTLAGYCPATIPASGGANCCKIKVRFTPTAATTSSGSVSLSYNNNVTTTSSALTFSATGKTTASLAYSAGTTYAFGSVRTTAGGTSTSDATLTLTNSGGASATVSANPALAAPFSFPGGTWPGTNGTCPTVGNTLASGSSCTVVVRYTPTTYVGSSAALTLSYNNGSAAATTTITLSGYGTHRRNWNLGSISSGSSGQYGSRGTSATTNIPSARDQSAFASNTTTTTHYLFGGQTGASSYLNDLWKYDGSAWTWLSGVATTNKTGVYGTRGTGATTNYPGSRSGANLWVSTAGVVYLFGGYGYDSVGNLGYLNDLWSYDTATEQWTWLTGDNTRNGYASYGVIETEGDTVTPGARHGAAAFYSSAENALYLHGGYGYIASGTSVGYLNDTFRFDLDNANATYGFNGRWTYRDGDTTLNSTGTYNAHAFNGTNEPGGRKNSAFWTDGTYLYIFGGYGYGTSSTSAGTLNDVWRYQPDATNQWQYLFPVDGTTVSVNQAISASTQGSASSSYYPAGVQGAYAWKDPLGSTVAWIFGGQNSSGSSYNTYWKFDYTTVTAATWLWNTGSTSAGAYGTYGTQGTSAATNLSGGQSFGAYWYDNSTASGILVQFGGTGVSSSADAGSTSKYNLLMSAD